jgi:glycosyltransferase involved in cell wall biosynthesis
VNIGFDAKRAFYNYSGLGNYSRSTINLLAKYFPENTHYLFTPETEDAIVFDTGRAKIVQPETSFYKFFKSFWRSYGMTTNFKKFKLDVFHGLSNEVPINSHFLRTRTIVSIHDLIFIRYPELYKPIDREIYYKKFKASAHKADKIIAISEQTKHDIINFLAADEKKIEVVYQGCNEIFKIKHSQIELDKVRKKYELPKNYILNVGTIEERKNALQIIKAVHYEKIDIPVVLVGKRTDYQDAIEEFITTEQVKNPVLFINSVDFIDLPAIYQMADVFVYPSIFEGFGIPIVEAMSSQVPVITSRGSCFPETAGNAALYAFHEDFEELAHQIKIILFQPDIRKNLIEKGNERALIFNDKDIANNIMKVYKSLF